MYFWLTLIALKRSLAAAENNFIGRSVYKLLAARTERKVKRVQALIRKNFLNHLGEIKQKRCLRITQATLIPLCNIKKDYLEKSAKRTISMFLKDVQTVVSLKKSILFFAVRARTVFRRFNIVRKVRSECRKRLKEHLDNSLLHLLEYDNLLPRASRVNLETKKLFYYKQEEKVIAFIVDMCQLLVLQERFGENSKFDAKRLIRKLKHRNSFLNKIWSLYLDPDYRYEAYIEKFDEFINLKNSGMMSSKIFKTEVLGIDRNLKDKQDQGTHWEFVFTKDSVLLQKISELNHKKIIFELLSCQRKSLMV